jgi:iron complex outermembrane receptor protein
LQIKFFILICSAVLALSAQAQNNVLHGDVFSCEGIPLEGAYIIEQQSGTSTITNSKGHFELALNNRITAVLRISFIGFQSITDTLHAPFKTQLYHMHFAHGDLGTVEITGHVGHGDLGLPQTYLESDFLEKNRRNSLVQSLEKIPGISGISLGAGITKPVIRGFSANRVLVSQGGIKQEGQQWGYDHGLEIDAFAVERMRIVKGASTLRYGPDATAGVIDILPIAPGRTHTLLVQAEGISQSNNQLAASSALVHINHGGWYLRLRASGRFYGDYRVPGDSFTYNSYKLSLYDGYLRNTAGSEKNLHADGGLVRKWGIIRVGGSEYKLEAGMFPGAFGIPRAYHTLDDGDARNIDLPRQDVSHRRAYSGADFYIARHQLSIDAGFQENQRLESSLPHAHGRAAAAKTEALRLLLQTGQFKVSFKSNPARTLHFETGLDGSIQENSVRGFEFLIPAYRQSQGGLFGIVHWLVGSNLELNAGLRSDARSIQPSSYTISLPSGNSWVNSTMQPIARKMTNYAGAIGMRLRRKRTTYTSSAARTFRFPNVSELYSNGVHHGTFRHELGNDNLPVETGWQIDAGLQYTGKKTEVSLSVFGNIFNNYLYLQPSARFSPLSEGGQIFSYRADPATFAGGEAEFIWTLIKSLKWNNSVEYVYNQNLNNRLPLPFTPPLQINTGILWQRDVGKWKDTYTGLDIAYTFAQNRTDRNEQPTPDWWRVDLRAGTSLRGGNASLLLFVEIQNVFDIRYFNHLSRYRLINLPEQGRNISLGITIPLTVELKH